MQVVGIIILLILTIIVGLGVGFLTYWPFYGAPFVPTQNKEIGDIFRNINLKKGQVFCDVGCGDGRLVFEATKITGTKGLGVDINWGLIQWCKFWAYLKNNRGTEFRCQNIFQRNLPKADVYFLYLWPGIVEKLASRFEEQGLINITVVSKSFEIIKWRKLLKKKFILCGRRFWVYEVAPK